MEMIYLFVVVVVRGFKVLENLTSAALVDIYTEDLPVEALFPAPFFD